MAEDLPPIVDLRQSATALRVQRGVMRMLRERHDMACYAEVPLSNGRRADVLARRIISLLSQAPLVLNDADSKFYRRFLRHLAREIRTLRYTAADVPDGMPRLQVQISLCYASLCLANQSKHIRTASRKLSDELQRQILPDGGHISRNPGALVELLLDLLPLRQTFAARNLRLD